MLSVTDDDGTVDEATSATVDGGASCTVDDGTSCTVDDGTSGTVDDGASGTVDGGIELHHGTPAVTDGFPTAPAPFRPLRDALIPRHVGRDPIR